MSHSVLRALVAAVLGALAGTACFAAVYARVPDVTLEMDRDLPRYIGSGFYPPERDGEQTFVWTSGRAEVTLPDLNRDSQWECSLRFRGGRADPATQPLLDVAVDGISAVRRTATNEFQDVPISAPARPLQQGLTLTITSSSTVVPGPSDRRALGVQVDRLACGAAAGSLVLPPPRAIGAAAVAGAAFGAALGLTGITLGSAAAVLALLAAGQAFVLSTGLAPYSTYPRMMLSLAVWIAFLMLAVVKLLELRTGQALRTAARLVVIVSAVALYLKLLGLLHPSKPIIDAVFHAHRLEWVLGGRFYFTQPVRGMIFPYAIGLYLFAAPWSVFTSDHVALLRIVVSASEVVAGALLYPLIVRTWGDRLVGLLAVILFNLVPLPYWLVGNANLTNAFGQSVALVTVVAASIWPLRPRQFGQLAGLFVLAALAFLSHVSTVAVLFVTLVAMALVYRWLGGPTLRATARSVFVISVLAAVFSVVTYYGHFREVYSRLGTVRPQAAATSAPAEAEQARPAETGAGPPAARAAPGASLPARMMSALDLTVASIGWPIVVLAIAGGAHLWIAGTRDRLVFLLAAWGIAAFVFLAVGIATPVDPQFQRYAL